jgi:photosystem II stability/assembly factor-like uncharacterized protein
MKNFLLLLITVFIISPLYSQELNIHNNPYDNIPEDMEQRNSFKREKWFYEQRMYPNNFIPEDAYQNAVEQRNRLRSENGFFADNRNTWVVLGPTPGFYFNYSNISGRVTTAQYHPTNPNIIYIGAAFGGVWKSTNAGVTWESKTDNEVSLSSGSIAIDPVNPNIVYYGTGEATYSAASYYGRGILKSTDGGETWTGISTGLPNSTYTSRLVIRPNFPDQLFAAMGTAGFYKSTNAGASWTQVIGGRCDDVVFSPTGDTCYIVGSGVSYRISIDGGSTFTTNSTVSMQTRNHIAICKAFPNIMYIARYSGSTITVFKSTDAGFNFSQVATGTNFSGSQAWYDFYMHVNPFDPDYAYVGSIDIWRTTNGGTSFQNITNGYSNGIVHVDQHNLAFHPTNSNEILSVNDGGVWKSLDRGTTWVNLNSTLTLTQFYRLTSDPSNANHILGGTQDNGTQRTLGTQNWYAAFGGDGGEVCFQSQNNLQILGETQNNGVRRSWDGGNSWSAATSGLSGSGSWVGPILSHPDSADIFYTARQQVFKTTNAAASWFAISSGTSGTIREMAISNSNPEIMYASSGSSLFRSTNRGYSYTNVSSGSGLPARTITGISIHPDSSAVAVLTVSGFGTGHIYKTTNTGSTWTNISGNLPDSPANTGLIYYPGFSTSVILVGLDVGVFITNNYGSSWIELADGLPNTVAMKLDYNLSANKLRIGTHGRGTWEITNLTGITSMVNSMPDDYQLYQNYPNPFNPTTNIRYSLKDNSKVTIVIYDMLGKEISKLVNQVQSAGQYEVPFNAVNLSSGIYYYKFTASPSNGSAGEFTDTKKMILIK